MDVNGPLDAALGAAVIGDLLALLGFLLALLATFVLALAHGAQAWRTISLFLNGAALACAFALMAGTLGLPGLPADGLGLLRGAAGLCAALSVLALWPALRRLMARPGEDARLPLLATAGGPLSLEDALGGSGAVVFAADAADRSASRADHRWRVPRGAAAAEGPEAALRERMAALAGAALARKAPVTDQFETTDAHGNPRWYEATATPGRFEDGQSGAVGCLLDVTRFRKAEADCRALLQEATHRAKNLLAIIQSVARLSAKTLGLPASAAEPFTARLQAVALCYDLLVREDWEAVPLADLLHSQLNHTLGNAASRAHWSGPALRLKPTAVQTLALAFHELAARARAQGAMATPDGQLRVTWEDANMRDGSPGFRLIWQETGHGPEQPADRRAFARDILERLTPRGLRGDVTSTQTKEGFRWEVRFPATNVLPPREG